MNAAGAGAYGLALDRQLRRHMMSVVPDPVVVPDPFQDIAEDARKGERFSKLWARWWKFVWVAVPLSAVVLTAAATVTVIVKSDRWVAAGLVVAGAAFGFLRTNFDSKRRWNELVEARMGYQAVERDAKALAGRRLSNAEKARKVDDLNRRLDHLNRIRWSGASDQKATTDERPPAGAERPLEPRSPDNSDHS
jgi:hypothetical protein